MGANDTALAYYGFSCPKQGSFYICENSAIEFIGCCTSDPCANGGECPDDDLRTSSFSSDNYEDILVQDCNNVNGTSNWWVCRDNSPPFIGCCNVNPCGTGCPTANLVPAMLSNDTVNRDSILDPEDTSTATASATSSPDDDGGLSTGAITGIAAGAAVIGLIILGVLLWRCWIIPKKRKRDEQQMQQIPQASPTTNPHMSYNGSYAPSYPGSPDHHVTATPMSHYQSSFSSTPTAAHYPSGVSVDAYGKLSPYSATFEQSQSMTNFSDVSTINNRPPNYQYSPVPMIPVQEMDGTATLPPQELGTGDEIHPQQDTNQSRNSYRAQSPETPHHNQLGISNR